MAAPYDMANPMAMIRRQGRPSIKDLITMERVSYITVFIMIMECAIRDLDAAKFARMPANGKVRSIFSRLSL
jgi:hypothetical protein